MKIRRAKTIALAIVFLSTSFSWAMVQSRLIPVAHDKGTLKILLVKVLDAKIKQSFWKDPSNLLGELQPIAQGPAAITSGKNAFQFIPVNFVQASNLYKGYMVSSAVKDVVWVDPNSIDYSASKPTMTIGKFKKPDKKGVMQTETITTGVAHFLQQNWKTHENQLKKIVGIQPSQPAIQTDDSIGKNKLAPWLSSQSTGLQAFTNINNVTKYAKPGYIYFYHRNQPYYEFTNYYAAPVSIDGTVWPTTEHYFQAMKSINPQEQETIRNLPTPDAARKYWFNKQFSMPNWLQQKKLVMLKAVRAKINQHTTIKNSLLNTGNTIIVENTFLANYDDPYWGNGLNDNGDNDLGRILMQVRAEHMNSIPVKDEYPYQGSLKKPVQPIPPVMPSQRQLGALSRHLQKMTGKLKELEGMLDKVK